MKDTIKSLRDLWLDRSAWLKTCRDEGVFTQDRYARSVIRLARLHLEATYSDWAIAAGIGVQGMPLRRGPQFAKVVHMMHVPPGGLEAFQKRINDFFGGEGAVCSTPVKSTFRYAAQYRIGLVYQAELCRFYGYTLAWYGTSWMWPTPAETVEIRLNAMAQIVADSPAAYPLEFAGLDSGPVPCEVWTIPSQAIPDARGMVLRGVEVADAASAETQALAKAVAAAYRVPLRVIKAGEWT